MSAYFKEEEREKRERERERERENELVFGPTATWATRQRKRGPPEARWGCKEWRSLKGERGRERRAQ
jgi:hypothetical protein